MALNIVNHLALGDGGFKWLVQQLKQSVLFLKRTSVRDKRESLEACFDLSYNRLDEDLARLFRSLSIFPQPFEAEPVAYVLGWNPAKVMEGFRLLKEVGLVSQQEKYQPECTGCSMLTLARKPLKVMRSALLDGRKDSPSTIWV